MADDFDAGMCSGNWWNTARINSNTGFDASMDTPIPPISTFGISPTPTMNSWSQSLLSSCSERDETSFHDIMIQEPVNYFRQDSSIIQPAHQIQMMNQEHFLMGQPQQSGIIFPAMPQQSIYNQLGTLNNYGQPSSSMMGTTDYNQAAGSNDSIQNFTQLLKSSPPPKQQSSSSSSSTTPTSTTNQLQFSNNAPFWNPSASTIYPSPPPVQFVTRRFEQKPTKSNNMDSPSMKKSSSEASLKKPRIETPSPLPTFKIRKEKLGDRITALQQLVSPFGKTDTASVLHEAIDYIKFLHDQVNVLSTPYLKNGHPMQHQQNSSDKSKYGEGMKQLDLRSRGLCLVPMESIYPVATETTADFWTPTFGGTYR